MTNAVARGMLDYTLALVTNDNFGAPGFTGAASTFGYDKTQDLATALTAAYVPDDERFLILSPSVYGALAKDVKAAYLLGTAALIQENKMPQISGFNVLQYSALPSNGENLIGFGGAPEGLAVAARMPAIPENFPGMIETATDSESGVSLQVRYWYSADQRQHFLESGVIYGASKGVPGNVTRLVSA
jgi:hypothetical protein